MLSVVALVWVLVLLQSSVQKDREGVTPLVSVCHLPTPAIKCPTARTKATRLTAVSMSVFTGSFLSIYSSIHPYIHPFTDPFVRHFVYKSILLPTYSSIHLSIHLDHPTNHQPLVRSSIHPLMHPSTHLFIQPPTSHPSTGSSAHPLSQLSHSVQPFVCPSIHHPVILFCRYAMRWQSFIVRPSETDLEESLTKPRSRRRAHVHLVERMTTLHQLQILKQRKGSLSMLMMPMCGSRLVLEWFRKMRLRHKNSNSKFSNIDYVFLNSTKFKCLLRYNNCRYLFTCVLYMYICIGTLACITSIRT